MKKSVGPNARPIRWLGWIRKGGPNTSRIYASDSTRFLVRQGVRGSGSVAELRVYKKLGLKNLGLICLMALVGSAIGLLAISMNRAEVGWAMIGIGWTGSIVMGLVIVSDFVQSSRLPTPILHLAKNGTIELYAGDISLQSETASLRLTLRKSTSGSRSRNYQELDLLETVGDELMAYQLMAVVNEDPSNLYRIAERLAALTGLDLIVDRPED